MLDRLERDPTVPNANGSTSGPLSSRELTVVRYLASRLTYKEIAAELFVSTNTLKTHVKRIYQKLGVSSRMRSGRRSTSPRPLLTSAPSALPRGCDDRLRTQPSRDMPVSGPVEVGRTVLSCCVSDAREPIPTCYCVTQ